jgi:hypothetical protein
MKNKMMLIGLAIVATTMFSCKKDYDCKCNKIYTDSNGTTTVDDGTYTFRATKVKAASKCNDQERTGSDLGGDYSRECDLK